MNWIKIILFLLLPLCSFSQSENPYANGVGINLVQGNFGTGISFRYRRQIAKRGIAKLELTSNVRYSYGGRIGYEPFQFRWKKLELGIGLDLHYEFIELSMFGQSNVNEWTIELPIELRYDISSEYNFSIGMSFSHLLNNRVISCCHETISEIRFGLGYNF